MVTTAVIVTTINHWVTTNSKITTMVTTINHWAGYKTTINVY